MPPEWILESEDWNWECDAENCAITALYKCCCPDKLYAFSCVRMGISLMEWITLIIIGILIDNDVIQDKTSYLFKTEHCLYFFIVCLIFYVIFTLFPYLMPDLRLPVGIPIRSVHGYAFLGEQTELERLKNNVDNNSNFWDTPSYRGGRPYDFPSIFALSNKQYETLKWLESNGAKQHIELFKTRDEFRGVSCKKMGFEWARTIVDPHYEF